MPRQHHSVFRGWLRQSSLFERQLTGRRNLLTHPVMNPTTMNETNQSFTIEPGAIVWAFRIDLAHPEIAITKYVIESGPGPMWRVSNDGARSYLFEGEMHPTREAAVLALWHLLRAHAQKLNNLAIELVANEHPELTNPLAGSPNRSGIE